MADDSDDKKYVTFSHLPEISAACLRVMVLEDEKSGIDKLPGWVRFRVEEAARTLDECAKRIAALEKYVGLVIKAEKKAFAALVEECPPDSE